MVRLAAAIAAIVLMLVGAFFIWRGGTSRGDGLPPAPLAQAAVNQSGVEIAPIPDAPEADPKSKEEKRFDRSDKDKNGTITLAELVEPRRKPFAKLDRNGDGRLSFEEWAVKTIDKFDAADADGSNGLTRAEYATTAPKPKKKKPQCVCPENDDR